MHGPSSRSSYPPPTPAHMSGSQLKYVGVTARIVAEVVEVGGERMSSRPQLAPKIQRTSELGLHDRPRLRAPFGDPRRADERLSAERIWSQTYRTGRSRD